MIYPTQATDPRKRAWRRNIDFPHHHVNDIPIHHNTTLCMFADDTAILASHTEPKLTWQSNQQTSSSFRGLVFQMENCPQCGKTEAVFLLENTINLTQTFTYTTKESLGLRAPTSWCYVR
ncbi:hypothetical protein TNCV_4269241 [Trichonephila clavipes]|nr:hypothetical protein TNCV_4269241 [Trichonephila clavipes]